MVCTKKQHLRYQGRGHQVIPKELNQALRGGTRLAPECNDFSKLRLLPDRPGYNGPKGDPGTDPRKGLAGKHGKTFRQLSNQTVELDSLLPPRLQVPYRKC